MDCRVHRNNDEYNSIIITVSLHLKLSGDPNKQQFLYYKHIKLAYSSVHTLLLAPCVKSMSLFLSRGKRIG